MVNCPEGERLMSTDLTGPWSPLLSLYLNPVEPIAAQNDLPVEDVPCGRLNTWEDGVVPNAKTCRTAPPAGPAFVGLPTIVFGLFFSLPLPVILRFVASTPGFGSLIVID